LDLTAFDIHENSRHAARFEECVVSPCGHQIALGISLKLQGFHLLLLFESG
jgi:hypothetical protein